MTGIKKKLQLLIDCMDCYQPTICSNPLLALIILIDERRAYHQEGMADLTDNFLENLRIILIKLGGNDQASFYKNLSREVNSNPDTGKRYKLLTKYINQILEWQTSPWSLQEENWKNSRVPSSLPSLLEGNRKNLSAMNSLLSLLNEKPAEFELYLTSKFDSSKCNGLNRNAIILTNDDDVYFIIDNKIVLEDTLCLMSAQEVDDDTRIEPGKIYIRKLYNNILEYAVFCTDDKKVKRSFISKDQLPELSSLLAAEKFDKTEVKECRSFLGEILKITSKKGHTHSLSSPQRVKINRQKLATSHSDKPQLCTGKEREKRLIIDESVLKGGKENNRILNKIQFQSGDRYTLKQVDQIVDWIDKKNEPGADRLLVSLFRNYEEEESRSFELKESLTEFLKATQGVQLFAIMLLHSARQGGLSIKFNGPLYREIVKGCMGASLPKKRHLLKSKIAEQIRELMKIRLQIEDNFYVFQRAFSGIPETKSDKPTEESLEKELIKALIDEGGVHYRVHLLRDKIAEMMIPVMEIYEKLNDQSTARLQLRKDLDLIYKTTGTGFKEQQALHDSVRQLKEIKLDSARGLVLDSKLEEPKLFTLFVKTFFSKVQADLTDKLRGGSDGSRVALTQPGSVAPKGPIDMKSLENMVDVIAKIPGQPVSAPADQLFKDLTLTLSGPQPKLVLDDSKIISSDIVITIPEQKNQLSDLQSSSLSESFLSVIPETQALISSSETSHLPITLSQPVSAETTGQTITIVTPLALDAMSASIPVADNPEINQVDQILRRLAAISRAETDVPLPLLNLVNGDLLQDFMEVFFSDVLNQDIIISTGTSGRKQVNIKRKEWSHGLEKYFEERIKKLSTHQQAMRAIVLSYMQIKNPDEKYAPELFCKLLPCSLRSAVASASKTLKTKSDSAALIPKRTKSFKEFFNKTAVILQTKFYVYEDSSSGEFRPPALYPASADLYSQAIFLIHKKIGCDLYLMSEFDIEQCREMRGNAVILTNKNTAYFIIEDKIVLKNKKPQNLSGINRHEIELSDSIKPKKYMVSGQKKEKIIEEATLKGGHTQKINHDVYLPLIPGTWLKTLQNGTAVLKVFAKKKAKVNTRAIQLDDEEVDDEEVLAVTDDSKEEITETKHIPAQVPKETSPGAIPEKSILEIKRAEEPIPVPKELTLSFKPEDIQYEEKEKRLIQTITADIQGLAGLMADYRETTEVMVERSILSLNNASIKVFLNIWSSAKMDAEVDQFQGVTIRDFFRQKLKADEKSMSATPSAKSQALRFLLNLPFHILASYNSLGKSSFFQLNADHFKINGLTDKADELFWIASFMALPIQLSSRFSDYLQLKKEVESKTSKHSDDTPQQKLSNFLKITVVRYQENQSLPTVTKNGSEAAIIYVFEDTTGCYPLVSAESLILQPQRILELMRAMDSLKKIELPSRARTVSVSGLTSPRSPSIFMTPPSPSSTESPGSVTQSPSQIQSPEDPGTASSKQSGVESSQVGGGQTGSMSSPGTPQSSETAGIVALTPSPTLFGNFAQRLRAWQSPASDSSSIVSTPSSSSSTSTSTSTSSSCSESPEEEGILSWFTSPTDIVKKANAWSLFSSPASPDVPGSSSSSSTSSSSSSSSSSSTEADEIFSF